MDKRETLANELLDSLTTRVAADGIQINPKPINDDTIPKLNYEVLHRAVFSQLHEGSPLSASVEIHRIEMVVGIVAFEIHVSYDEPHGNDQWIERYYYNDQEKQYQEDQPVWMTEHPLYLLIHEVLDPPKQ